MSQSYRDMFSPGARDYPGPVAPPVPGDDPQRPTFADLVSLCRAPKGILSGEEHRLLLDHVRSLLGLPPVEYEEEDEIIDVTEETTL